MLETADTCPEKIKELLLNADHRNKYPPIDSPVTGSVTTTQVIYNVISRFLE